MVIKESLCDRQTEVLRPHFPARSRAGSGHKIGEEIARCSQRKTAPAVCVVRVAVLFLFLVFSLRGFAQEPAPEYQIKAAFLFNFAKFVDWPPQAFPQATSPIIVGVLGKNVFGHYLQDTIRDKQVKNRRFEIKEFASVNDALNCHILFISPSLKDDLPKILSALRNTSVLTVSESDQFIPAGGMINFTIEESKVHFQINDDAAKKAGLRISSKLLSLAARNH